MSASSGPTRHRHDEETPRHVDMLARRLSTLPDFSAGLFREDRRFSITIRIGKKKFREIPMPPPAKSDGDSIRTFLNSPIWKDLCGFWKSRR